MTYAKNTTVAPEKSQAEIKRTLSKYGATAFAFAESKDRAMVRFEMNARHVKFMLPIPILQSPAPSWNQKKGLFYSQDRLDQELRRRWRCLLLAIKSKLECVETGITTFEQEFMAHIVLPDGSTVGEFMAPQIEISYRDGKMPSLLGYGGTKP